MAGNDGSCLNPCLVLDVAGQNVRGCCLSAAGLKTLSLLHLGFLAAHRTLSDRNYREGLSALVTPGYHLAHFIRVIGDFGDEDDVGTAGNTGVERQPANLVAHDLDEHRASMACSRGMDAVNTLGVDIQCGVEAEGYVGAPDIVVDCLGKSDDVAPGICQQGCGLVGSGSA